MVEISISSVTGRVEDAVESFMFVEVVSVWISFLVGNDVKVSVISSRMVLSVFVDEVDTVIDTICVLAVDNVVCVVKMVSVVLVDVSDVTYVFDMVDDGVLDWSVVVVGFAFIIFSVDVPNRFSVDFENV